MSILFFLFCSRAGPHFSLSRRGARRRGAKKFSRRYSSLFYSAYVRPARISAQTAHTSIHVVLLIRILRHTHTTHTTIYVFSYTTILYIVIYHERSPQDERDASTTAIVEKVVSIQRSRAPLAATSASLDSSARFEAPSKGSGPMAFITPRVLIPVDRDSPRKKDAARGGSANTPGVISRRQSSSDISQHAAPVALSAAVPRVLSHRPSAHSTPMGTPNQTSNDVVVIRADVAGADGLPSAQGNPLAPEVLLSLLTGPNVQILTLRAARRSTAPLLGEHSEAARNLSLLALLVQKCKH
jgi:hypothetical protein